MPVHLLNFILNILFPEMVLFAFSKIHPPITNVLYTYDLWTILLKGVGCEEAEGRRALCDLKHDTCSPISNRVGGLRNEKKKEDEDVNGIIERK